MNVARWYALYKISEISTLLHRSKLKIAKLAHLITYLQTLAIFANYLQDLEHVAELK